MQKVPKVVILRTGNMKFYKGVKLDVEKQFRDELRFGGGYVAQHHDGGETYNFARGTEARKNGSVWAL